MGFYLDDSVPSNKNESNEDESNEDGLILPIITKNLNKNNFSELKMGPGLYVIWNTAINKFYVGQSNNVPARLASHWNELKLKRHECKLMQEHWNGIGSQHFKFICLDVNEKWRNEDKRKDAELELIHLNDSVVYNILIPVKEKKHNYRKAVCFTDITYPSIAEAARMENISETQVRRLIRDNQNLNWSEALPDNLLDENLINIEKARKVQVHNRVYLSIREAAKQTGISRRTLTRHLNSSNHDYCCFI